MKIECATRMGPREKLASRSLLTYFGEQRPGGFFIPEMIN